MENSASGRLSEHARNIGDEASQAARETHGAVAETASKYAGQAKDYAQQAAGQAKDYAKQGYDFASKKSQEIKSQTEGYITTNPWYAVGIALGVGVLVGLLVRGSNRD